MELPVVVGVDGSDSSLRAVDWAADEAELHQVPLQLVHASKGERYEGAALTDTLGRPSERVLAENIIGSARERAQRRHPDLKIATEILMEDPEAALLNAGRNASTLVTGSRGRSEITGLLLGSVSLAVAARADCPVVVLRGSHDSQATPRDPPQHRARGRRRAGRRGRGPLRLPRGGGPGSGPAGRTGLALPPDRGRPFLHARPGSHPAVRDDGRGPHREITA